MPHPGPDERSHPDSIRTRVFAVGGGGEVAWWQSSESSQ